MHIANEGNLATHDVKLQTRSPFVERRAGCISSVSQRSLPHRAAPIEPWQKKRLVSLCRARGTVSGNKPNQKEKCSLLISQFLTRKLELG
jgi:hypothetical protein